MTGNVNELKANLDGQGAKVAVAVAEFNEVVTKSLLEGAVSKLEALGVAPKDVTVAHVPGASGTSCVFTMGTKCTMNPGDTFRVRIAEGTSLYTKSVFTVTECDGAQ